MSAMKLRRVNGQPVKPASTSQRPEAVEQLSRVNAALTDAQRQNQDRDAQIADLRQQLAVLTAENGQLKLENAQLRQQPAPEAPDPMTAERLIDLEKRVSELNQSLLDRQTQLKEAQARVAALEIELKKSELQSGIQLGGMRDI